MLHGAVRGKNELVCRKRKGLPEELVGNFSEREEAGTVTNIYT